MSCELHDIWSKKTSPCLISQALYSFTGKIILSGFNARLSLKRYSAIHLYCDRYVSTVTLYVYCQRYVFWKTGQGGTATATGTGTATTTERATHSKGSQQISFYIGNILFTSGPKGLTYSSLFHQCLKTTQNIIFCQLAIIWIDGRGCLMDVIQERNGYWIFLQKKEKEKKENNRQNYSVQFRRQCFDQTTFEGSGFQDDFTTEFLLHNTALLDIIILSLLSSTFQISSFFFSASRLWMPVQVKCLMPQKTGKCSRIQENSICKFFIIFFYFIKLFFYYFCDLYAKTSFTASEKKTCKKILIIKRNIFIHISIVLY